MVKKSVKNLLATMCLSLGIILPVIPASAAANEFRSGENGKMYWYENDVRQGTLEDVQGVLGDGTNRGREIYDPASDGWYWLDSCYDGAKAVGKEVWIPYVYQEELVMSSDGYGRRANGISSGIRILQLSEASCTDEADMSSQVAAAIENRTGKWVRYDENGAMIKGWVTIEGALAKYYPEQVGNTYYYDRQTGLMAKGWLTINGYPYYFDETTGVLSPSTPRQDVNSSSNTDTSSDSISSNSSSSSSSSSDSTSSSSSSCDTSSSSNCEASDSSSSSDTSSNSSSSSSSSSDTSSSSSSSSSSNSDTSSNNSSTNNDSSNSNTSSDTSSSSNNDYTDPIQLSSEEQAAYNAIIALKTQYPEGMYYTNESAFYVSKSLYYNGQRYTNGGYGCHAFALMASDAAFDDASLYDLDDNSKVRIGDIIRLDGDTHTVIVIGFDYTGITVAEGNYNSSVHWGRKLPWSTLDTCDYIMSRYADSWDGTHRPTAEQQAAAQEAAIASYPSDVYDLLKETYSLTYDDTYAAEAQEIAEMYSEGNSPSYFYNGSKCVTFFGLSTPEEMADYITEKYGSVITSYSYIGIGYATDGTTHYSILILG